MNSEKDDLENKRPLSPGGTKKFMFDLHSFDAPEEDEEDLEPPPPTFSEEELATARQAGYDEGFKKATEESAASRDQYLAQQFEVIKQNYTQLFSAELERAEVFEREVVALCKVMIARCFPVLNEEYGQAELEAIIKQAFEQNEGVSEIVVFLRSEDKDDIETRMELMNPRPEHLICEVDDSLDAGSVKMKWKDGGAIRDPVAMGEKIADILTKTLASAEGNAQNQNVEDGGDDHE